MPEIELTWFPGTCSRVTLAALEEIGQPFRTRLAPVARGTDPGFLSLNPKGKVPVLVIDSAPLTETPAIMTHLDRLYPSAGLLPGGDPLVALDALATMSWIAGGIHPSITRLRYPLRFCDAPGSADRTRALAAEALRGCFEVAEERLADREWIYDKWSVVDAYLLWAWFRAVGCGMDAQGLVRCAAHAARCECWPSVARALDREEATYAEMLAAGAIAVELPPHQVGRTPALT
ncbi:MAG: glutathione S-transferase family protein [Solirubrobacteraceae bacterium]